MKRISLILLAAFIALAFFPVPGQRASAAPEATYVVTNTNDNGSGSLRRAIKNANTAGGGTINFNIPGSGVHAIRPNTGLPKLNKPITIDGYTQPGASPNTLAVGDNAVLQIALDGSACASQSVCEGLDLEGGGSTVRGLAIYHFAGAGQDDDIFIASNANIIQGNFIRTDAAGTYGGDIERTGIRIENGSSNTIGGATPGERNLISGGHFGSAVNIQGIDADIDSNIIEGNYVGTDKTGTAAMVFSGAGIYIGASLGFHAKNTVIRGNLISGNAGANPGQGIAIVDAIGTVIVGNLIGTDGTGTIKLPNTGDGVIIADSVNTLVGGTTTADRNVISGNQLAGIGIGELGKSDRILGNYIGTDKSGTINLGNGMSGILITADSQKSLIGGKSAKSANHIANNGGAGIEISGSNSTQNAILRNSIYNNTGLGIDLNGDDITQNDAGDADTGPNNLQNFPLITFAQAATKKINGSLGSKPNTKYIIRFFESPACSALGNGEGERFLGGLTVTTNNAGHVGFAGATVKGSFNIGDTITATATDPNGNTSEFSACKTAT